MSEINVWCHTNIDEFHTQIWPSKVACRPMVGDFIESKDGTTLRIVRIVHSQNPITHVPLLKIELHYGSAL